MPNDIVKFKNPVFLGKKYGIIPQSDPGPVSGKQRICIVNYFPKSFYPPSSQPCINVGEDCQKNRCMRW